MRYWLQSLVCLTALGLAVPAQAQSVRRAVREQAFDHAFNDIARIESLRFIPGAPRGQTGFVSNMYSSVGQPPAFAPTFGYPGYVNPYRLSNYAPPNYSVPVNPYAGYAYVPPYVGNSYGNAYVPNSYGNPYLNLTNPYALPTVASPAVNPFATAPIPSFLP